MNKGTCPMCGGENHCHIANNKDIDTCWCMTKEFPKDLPRHGSCICEKCIDKISLDKNK